jgi:hypothetical protein
MGQGSESIGWDDMGQEASDPNSIHFVPIISNTSANVKAKSVKNIWMVRYDLAKKATVGETIECPACGKKFPKRSYQHAFCCNKGRNNCKDRYWNTVDETRADRARLYA